MAQKARKNYTLSVTENQPTVTNIKNINDSIFNESLLRKNADISLSSQITNALTQILNLQNEIVSLENAANNINFYKETFTLSLTDLSNGYIDAANKAKDNSMRIEMGCITLQENVDYTLSTVNNKTRITFIDNALDPFFEKDDVLFVQYYSSI